MLGGLSVEIKHLATTVFFFYHVLEDVFPVVLVIFLVSVVIFLFIQFYIELLNAEVLFQANLVLKHGNPLISRQGIHLDSMTKSYGREWLCCIILQRFYLRKMSD